MRKILLLIFLGLLVKATSSIAQIQQDALTLDSLSGNDSIDNVSEDAVVFQLSKSAGDEAFSNGNYESAIKIYESILNEQGEAADIYYNLGNSYYKKLDLAKAILNYERALLLNPGDNDIRFNLELAKSKTVDKTSPMNELFLVTWIKNIIAFQGTDAWAKCSISTFILFIVCLLLYIFGRRILFRKLGFVFAFVFLIITVIFNIFSSYQMNLLENRTNAIIVVPTVTAKSTPNGNGTDLFVIHEGHKVEIKDATMREWKEIRLEDGNVGWVPTNSLEII